MSPRARPGNLARLHDCEPAVADFLAEVTRGLSRPQKEIPAKFFYDEVGSRLFEAICALPEYYPTRTETAILSQSAPDLGRHLPAGAVIIELGSGLSDKIALLLAAVRAPAAYVPVDIAREAVAKAAAALARNHPQLTVKPVCADFLSDLRLPNDLPPGPRVAFFPGSTIGNFHPDEAAALLTTIGACVGIGGFLLIGVDLKKDPVVLRRAYDDGAGVTAAFNRNLLARINRELGGDFDLSSFRHRADYNARCGRIEMHLVSTTDQSVGVGGQRFRFRAGESIHTENSYKYRIEEFQALAARAGFRPVTVWTDARSWFSVQLFSAT